jgi:hypothetical protein
MITFWPAAILASRCFVPAIGGRESGEEPGGVSIRAGVSRDQLGPGRLARAAEREPGQHQAEAGQHERLVDESVGGPDGPLRRGQEKGELDDDDRDLDHRHPSASAVV